MPTELKHCTAPTVEIVLLERSAWPRFEIDACRPDGVVLLAATDDEDTAEAIYLCASLAL